MKSGSLSYMRTFLLSCVFFLGTGLAGYAADEKAPVQAHLISEEEAIQPGRSFWVGINLEMAEGWDTYWLNPGDSGFPTQVNWNLPEGFKAGPLLWPYPEKFVVDSLVAFGYIDTVLLMTEITPPSNLPADQKINIGADVNWLACKESCVPGNASLALALPVTDRLPIIDATSASLFSSARKALPQKGENVTVSSETDEIVLNFKPQPGAFGEIESLFFIPEQGEVIDYMAPQSFSIDGDRLTLSMKRMHSENALSTLKGVLLISEKGSSMKRAIQVDNEFDSAEAAAPEAALPEGVSTVAVALLFAFLGGMILNVMPCVLPVIALKIFGFVKMADQKKSVIFKHGGVFSFGVLVSFWILSGALLILRAYGEGIGWGFQLQEPVFVAILAVLLFLLGLSLFGLFEMGTSLISFGGKTTSTSSPLTSSFMSGVLATLVATPCTGPLLGPALGFAMTLSPLSALSIFTAMGIGMSFPYLLFSAFPQLVRYLPKPGNWMDTFKQLMGFLMMATVVWLIWVFGAQTDEVALFALLVALLMIAIGAWIFGKWGALNRGRITRMIATLVAALIVFTGAGGIIVVTKRHQEVVSTSEEAVEIVSENGWAAYSPERVEELRKLGTPVFVDFTAKWCLICQTNKVVLHSSEIQKAFQEKGVVLMTADWTKRDAVITEQLTKLGRTGVPVYVLYSSDPKEAPQILPQTLSAKVVHSYLDKLKTPSTTVFAS